MKSYSLPLYLVAFVSTLTTAGGSFVLLALSASLLTYSPGGEASSALQTLFYLGVAITGLFGGWILQRTSFFTIGFLIPLLLAFVTLVLCLIPLTPIVGLSFALLLYILGGIDHPNNLRFYREVLPPEKTAQFFSLVQGVTTLVTFGAPALAGFIVQFRGPIACLRVAATLYAISALPWLLVRHLNGSGAPANRPGLFSGFAALIQSPDLTQLTAVRLLNNLAFVTWTTALPIVLASTYQAEVDQYAAKLGWTQATFCAAFALFSLLLGGLFKNRPLPITSMTYAAPVLGAASVLILAFSWLWPACILISAVFAGVGTYCFRISGMTVGQLLTPKHLLADVVIAGDTLVRFASFAISTAIVGLTGLSITGTVAVATLALIALVYGPSLSRKTMHQALHTPS